MFIILFVFYTGPSLIAVFLETDAVIMYKYVLLLLLLLSFLLIITIITID